jgi:SAM-dependent methyltransferase
MPTLDYLSNAYPTDYYSYAPMNPEIEKSKLKKRIMRALRTLLFYHQGMTGNPKFKTPGRMLDFGCGSGSFLAEMRDKGWKVHGVELDALAAERGRSQGFDIFGGTIDDAGYESASFDYVRSNHSFEHIHNPREVLREMRRIVKPTGVVFIGVPNVSGLMARLYGTYWWYLGAPVHPFGYNPDTLGRLLSESGFKVERVNYNSSFSGIFGSLQLYLNRNNGKLGEDGWITHNRVLMVIGYWAARTLDFLRSGDCIEVIARPV